MNKFSEGDSGIPTEYLYDRSGSAEITLSWGLKRLFGKSASVVTP